MLNQLKVQEDGFKEAHHALMRVVAEQERKESAIVKLTALKIKMQDARDLTEDKLLDKVIVEVEVPVV